MTSGSIGLARYLQTLSELLKGSFSDLLFAGHKTENPLLIRSIGVTCGYVRMRLPGLGCLHLESVRVFCDSGDQYKNIAVNALLKCSSVYPGAESLLEARLLINPHNSAIGVHTDTGPNEWVCLQLDQAYVVKEIVVYNRDDRWKWRAWGLVIETSVDGIQWTELYNHGARQALLIDCLGTSCVHLGGTEQDLTAAIECTDLVRLIFANDLDECQKRMDQMLRSGAYGATEIRRKISELILSTCELDWNSHGIVRPFLYWAIEEKTEYLNQVAELVQDLLGLSPHVCLGFGIVLAYVRDGDLIPYDDDADLLIAFDSKDCSSISQGLTMLQVHLVSLGYEVSWDHFCFSHRWITKPTWNAALPQIDVFIGLREGDAVSWYPSERASLRFDDVFPADFTKFFNISCPIPRRPMPYLDGVYGPNWRIPDAKFGHPWNKADYEDIA